jgi:hypothetical protein
MSAVEVLGIRSIGKDALAAVARVRLLRAVEFDVKIFEDEDGKSWIGLPQAPIRRDGTGWKAVLAITDHDIDEELRAKVLTAWGRGR